MASRQQDGSVGAVETGGSSIVLTICGARDCRHFRKAVSAAEMLASEFPGQAGQPIILQHDTMADFAAWIADRDAWPEGFAGVVPTNHATSPLILEQDQGKQAPFVYIGSYDAAAERINLLAGGKLIAETGRQDKPALAVACVVLLAHCLLLFFLNPQPVAWRWTVSQTGAAVGAISVQMYSKS